MEFSNFSVEYFCSYKNIKTITFLNSINFKNRFLENYAYHIEIKKYVSNIFQQKTKKKNAKKNVDVNLPWNHPLTKSSGIRFKNEF